MRINIKILNNKRTVIAAVFFLCVVFIFLLLQPAWAGEFGADAAKAVVSILGWIVYFLAYVIGLLLTLIIKILIVVAGYSDIIGVKAVTTGWEIVRDLCNMFFILILLIIAFATILRIESYNAKKLLPKLLIMAVLINFSRTICGLIIDFAQVIMLTFVNGFAAAGEGNLVKVFQIEKFLAFAQGDDETKAIGAWETAGAILAGFIAIVITFIVVLVLLAVLVMRIIMLWVYTILSPLAFLLSAFPAGQKYSSQWWSEFSKNVIVGPVLAFFLWLALLTAHDSASKLTGLKGISSSATTTGAGITKTINLCAGKNALFCGDSFQTYIITIALLIGGLMVTQQIGGIAGSIAGKGMAAIQKGKGLAVGMAMKGVRTAITNTAKATSRTALRAGGAMIGAGAKEGSTRGKIGSFINQWGGDLKKTREKTKAEKRKKTLERLGMRDEVGGGMEKLDIMLKDKKIQRATNVVKGAGIAGVGLMTGNPALMVAGVVAGAAKGASKKGPIAGTMERHGKGREVIEAEENKEKVDKEVASERDNMLKPAEDIKNTRIQNIETMRQSLVSQLGPKPRHTDPEAVKTAYNDKAKTINGRAESGSKDVEEDFKKEKERVNAHRQGDLDKANSNVETARSRQGKVGKFFEDRGKEMKGPNHFTIEAVKLATEENRKVHKTVSDLGEEDVHEFDKRDFHSPGGPNSQQQKLFDALNSSTAEAAKALKKMTDSVKSMPQNINDAQSQTILSLKRMMAAQKAAGKDLGKFGDLIGELDKRSDIYDKKGNATVDAIAKTFSAKTES